MKRSILVFACLIAGVYCMNAQGDFRIGAHVGPVIGDADEFTSFTLGVDASYLWTLDETFSIGVASGYGNYLGKDDFSNYSFLPIAATGRANFAESWFGGLDLGYAIGLEEDSDGGFYYQPKVGWTNGMIDVFAYYQGISISDADFTISSIGAGAAVKL